MLAEEIAKLEGENQRLKELIKQMMGDVPKPKNCQNCKHYVQHYRMDDWGRFHKIYIGHCNCEVPIKKRNGKKEPNPEETCLCFEEKH